MCSIKYCVRMHRSSNVFYCDPIETFVICLYLFVPRLGIAVLSFFRRNQILKWNLQLDHWRFLSLETELILKNTILHNLI